MSAKKLFPYRPNVGVMVINKQGKVWVGHRSTPGNAGLDGKNKLWQMPQGGVDKGEELEAAAKRELFEETGITNATLLGRTDDWLFYDFPPEAPDRKRGKWQGQKQIWFAFRFEGSDEEINVSEPPDGAPVEFDDWQWVDVDEVPNLIVAFKRPVYDEAVKQLRHLAVPA